MGVAKFPALFALGVFYYDEMRVAFGIGENLTAGLKMRYNKILNLD